MLPNPELRRAHLQIIVDLLMTRCRWDEERYLWIAESARRPDLKFFLTRCAAQRRAFVVELRSFALRPDTGAVDAPPVVHRRARHAPSNDKQLILDCLEKEQNILRLYQDALEEDLPVALRTLIADQAMAIQLTCNFLRAFTRTDRRVAYSVPLQFNAEATGG